MQELNSRFLIRCIKVATIFLFVLTACSSSKLEPLGLKGTILAFGDSLTVGVGTDIESSYPSVLAELSGLEVVNSGISGETSSEGLKRLPRELDRIKPDLLILIEGGNDILRNINSSVIKENLKQMIELSKKRGIPVVLIGIPEKSLFSNSAPFYAELADEHDLVFESRLIGDLQRSPSLKSDRVHFNKLGYRKMGESIYGLLKENGALRVVKK